MTRKFLWLSMSVAIGTALLAAFIWQRGSGRNEELRADAVDHGRALYMQHCASCHGSRLEGQPNWRERLPNGRLPAPPHDASGHTWHHSDKQLFELTKRGPSAIVPGYQSDMPGFADVLQDGDIWSIIAFLKSTWPGQIRERQAQISRSSG